MKGDSKMSKKKIYSNNLKMEFEVNTTERVLEYGEIIETVNHDSLENIMYNHLVLDKNLGVKYSMKPLVLSPEHSVFECIITDNDGRFVHAIGESTTSSLKTTIALEYPSLISSQRAFDRAIIRYLGFTGRVYSNTEIMDDTKNNMSYDTGIRTNADYVSATTNASSGFPVSDTNNKMKLADRMPTTKDEPVYQNNKVKEEINDGKVVNNPTQSNNTPSEEIEELVVSSQPSSITTEQPVQEEIIEPVQEEIIEPVQENSTVEASCLQYVFDFGKFKGKTLADAVKLDLAWLKWVAYTLVARTETHKTAQSAAKEYFELVKNDTK